MLSPAARSAAFLLALSLLFNLAASAIFPAFDANEWLLDLRALPRAFAAATYVVLAAPLLYWSILPPHPDSSRTRRMLPLAAALTLAAIALANTAAFYTLLATDRIGSSLPIPLSLITALVALLIARAASRPAPPASLVAALALTPAWAAAFLLAQIIAFGSTDYRRHADAIVVFGARVYADGAPSLALEDRVRTAAALYHQGLAPTIVMSGGPGDGPTSEPQAMRRLAVSLGVPDHAILTDERGLNTRATIHNLPASLPRTPSPTLLAVSHNYHLARIKIAATRANLRAYTVPATESRPLARKPLFLAREIAALASYYFRIPIATTSAASTSVD